MVHLTASQQTQKTKLHRSPHKTAKNKAEMQPATSDNQQQTNMIIGTIGNFIPSNKIVVSPRQSAKRSITEKRYTKCLLAQTFEPGDFDIICAKGNIARQHSGNVRYRIMIDRASKMYGEMKGRSQKTTLVNEIIDSVRSKGGAFVKKNEKNGQWYEIDETQAREKVGQSLRERNHSQYKSTTKSKRKLRKDTDQKMMDQIESLVGTNDSVAAGIRQLSNSLERHFQQIQEERTNARMSSAQVDCELEIAMTQANSKILESLKSDESIQRMLLQQMDGSMTTAE